MRATWSLAKTTAFVQLNRKDGGRYCLRACDIALKLRCTVPAVQSMRRKEKHLRELGVRGPGRLASLLQVPEYVIHSQGLEEICRHASRKVVMVKRFPRRAKWSRKRHLVRGYVRRLQGTGRATA